MLTLEDLEDIDVQQDTVLDRYYTKKYCVGKHTVTLLFWYDLLKVYCSHNSMV